MAVETILFKRNVFNLYVQMYILDVHANWGDSFVKSLKLIDACILLCQRRASKSCDAMLDLTKNHT